MTLQIRFDQGGKPAGVNGVAREDLDLATAVQMTAVGASGASQYSWSFVGRPPKDDLSGPSTATISGSSTAVASTTPDNRGTYLVELAVDMGYGLGAREEDRVRLTFYAGPTLNPIYDELPRRIPSAFELFEHNVPDSVEPTGNTEGWAREWDRWFRVIEKVAASTVTSVFGRVGAVVAVAGDYVASQVGNDSSVPGTWVSDALDYLSSAISALPTNLVSTTLDGILNDTGGASLAFFMYDGSPGGSWIATGSNTCLVVDNTGTPTPRSGADRQFLGYASGILGFFNPPNVSTTYDGYVQSPGGISRGFFVWNGAPGGSWVTASSNTALVFNNVGTPSAISGSDRQFLGFSSGAIGFFALPTVTSTADGVVDGFPSGQKSVLTSDGTTAGGVWEAAYDFVPGLVGMFEMDRLEGGRIQACVDPDPTNWAATACSVTGSSSPWTLTSSAAGGNCRLDDNLNINYAAGVPTIFEVDAEAGTADFLYLYSNTGSFGAWFNLATGAVGTTSNVIDATITDLGSGVYRCRMLAASDGTSELRIVVAASDGSPSSATGDSIDIHRIRADVQTRVRQVENGAAPSSYASKAPVGATGADEQPALMDWDNTDPADSVWDGGDVSAVFYNQDSTPLANLEANELAQNFSGWRRPCAIYVVAKRIDASAGDKTLVSIVEDGAGYIRLQLTATTLELVREVNGAASHTASLSLATAGYSTGDWAVFAGYYDGTQLRVAVGLIAGGYASSGDDELILQAVEVNIGGESNGALYTPSQSDCALKGAYLVACPSDAPIVFGDTIDSKIRQYFSDRFPSLGI